MVERLGRGWRDQLATVAASASRSFLIAAPYIKVAEAEWLRRRIPSGTRVTTLTDINSDAVGTCALDIGALCLLVEAGPRAKLVALPSLHAKVFVADDKAAIVTSGNLTRSGLDTNIEYGVLLRESATVRNVSTDMLTYARLGAQVSSQVVAELLPLEAQLRDAHAQVEDSSTAAARRRFDDTIRRARAAFAAMQVGERSAHAVFGEAIRFVLESGPKTTVAIQAEIKELLPALCDDGDYFFINGVRYGRTWKRRMRHAQQHLKHKGVVVYNNRTKTWALKASETGRTSRVGPTHRPDRRQV